MSSLMEYLTKNYKIFCNIILITKRPLKVYKKIIYTWQSSYFMLLLIIKFWITSTVPLQVH